MLATSAKSTSYNHHVYPLIRTMFEQAPAAAFSLLYIACSASVAYSVCREGGPVRGDGRQRQYWSAELQPHESLPQRAR